MSGFPTYIQNPLFAPSSGQQQQNQQQQGGGGGGGGDDFDVNEIFADYFINEFDDPLNAYTSSMANYNGAAVKMEAPAAAAAAPLGATIQQHSGQPTLPTGGIKTAFRLGAVGVDSGVAGVVQQQPMKKARHEISLVHNPIASLQQGVFPTTTTAAGIGAAATTTTTPGGIATAGGIRVPLPVGVGIRMGGVGGVSPATVSSVDRSKAVLHSQLMMGGGADAFGLQAGMSDQAIAERRQRNREHAKRSRVRKKFMLESLQEEVSKLQRENQTLRLLIQESIPEHAQEIIAECCAKNPLFADDEQEESKTQVTKLIRSDFSLMDSLSASQQNFCLSDPRLPDNPVVFASPGFYKLTGYTSKEVLGRNCRFLQGPGTDTKTVEVIRKAVAIGADCTVCILNYKADGTPFWNQFFVAALRDSDNNIVNYVGVQCEVEPEAGASALEDRVNEVLPLQNKDGTE